MKHLTLAFLVATAFCTQSFAQKTKNLYTNSLKLNVETLAKSSADQSINITRSFLAGYNTLCLPVSLSASELQKCANNVQLEKFVAIRQDGDVLNLYFQDCTKEGLKAGEPYLIFSPETQIMKVSNAQELPISSEIKKVTMTDDEGNKVTFDSSWEGIRKAGRYGIPAQQEAYVLESVLIETDTDKVFLPTRCGFTWDSQSVIAKRLEIVHVSSLEGISTDLKSLELEGEKVDVYATNGTIVKKNVTIEEARQSLPSGIYVIKNQKIAFQ